MSKKEKDHKKKHNKKKYKSKQSKFKKFLPIIIMSFLWILLLSLVVTAIIQSYRAKNLEREIFNQEISLGYKFLLKGDYGSLKKSKAHFNKAMKYRQRDMKLWGGVLMAESLLQFRYNNPSHLFQKYRSAGITLISQDGRKTLHPESEPYWLAGLFFDQFLQSKSIADIKNNYFVASRNFGYYPSNEDLKTNLAISLASLGRPQQALKYLENVKSLNALFQRGMIHLEFGEKSKAAADFKMVLAKNPNFRLAQLGLIDSKNKIDHNDMDIIDRCYKHPAPTVNTWAALLKFSNIKDKKSPKLLDKFLNNSRKINSPYLLQKILNYYLNHGNTKRAMEFYTDLLKFRSTDSENIKMVDSKLFFIAGSPLKAVKVIKDLKKPKFNVLKVQYLWFAQLFQEARKKAIDLPSNNIWRLIIEGKPVQSKSPTIALAKIWKTPPEQNPQIVSTPEKNWTGKFYVKYYLAKRALTEAHKHGHGTTKADIELKKVINLLGDEKKSLMAMRLSALAYHCTGNDEKAYEIINKICRIGISKSIKDVICDSPEALKEDKELLLGLLLFPGGPESDIEIAISKSMSLIREVAKTRDSVILWKSRLALLQIRALPGSVENIAKKVLSLVGDTTKDLSPYTKLALAPIYALLGQSDKAIALWKSSYKNQIVMSLQIAKFLYEIGSIKEAMVITTTLLKRNDLIKSVQIKLLRIEAKCIIKTKKDAETTLNKLLKISSLAKDKALYAKGILLKINSFTPSEKTEKCKKIATVLDGIKLNSPDTIFEIISLGVKCGKTLKSTLNKTINNIPTNNNLRKKAQSLIDGIKP